MIASEIPVFWITRANMEPKTTSTIGALRRKAPFTMISLSQSKKGTPEIKAIHPAIRGSAKSVGKTLATMRAAKRTKPPRSKIPDNVNVITSCFLPNFSQHNRRRDISVMAAFLQLDIPSEYPAMCEFILSADAEPIVPGISAPSFMVIVSTMAVESM